MARSALQRREVCIPSKRSDVYHSCSVAYHSERAVRLEAIVVFGVVRSIDLLLPIGLDLVAHGLSRKKPAGKAECRQIGGDEQ